MLSIIYHVYTSFLRYLFKSGLLFFTVFIIFQFFCGLVPSVAHLERNDGETIKECEWGWIACQTGQRRSCGEQNRERQRREWKTRSKPAGSATGLPVQNCWTCLVAPLSFVARRTERLFFTRFSPVFFISPKMPARNRSGDGEIREGWRGRWEEERRGVMDESERWEATRRPSSVCEFLLEPTRPPENVVALLQETHPSVSVWGSGPERRGEKTERTHSIASQTHPPYYFRRQHLIWGVPIIDWCINWKLATLSLHHQFIDNKYLLWESQLISKIGWTFTWQKHEVFIRIYRILKELQNFPQSIFINFTISDSANCLFVRGAKSQLVTLVA